MTPEERAEKRYYVKHAPAAAKGNTADWCVVERGRADLVARCWSEADARRVAEALNRG